MCAACAVLGSVVVWSEAEFSEYVLGRDHRTGMGRFPGEDEGEKPVVVIVEGGVLGIRRGHLVMVARCCGEGMRHW